MKLKMKKIIFSSLVFVIFLSILKVAYTQRQSDFASPSLYRSASDPVWYIYDKVTPSLDEDEVEWIEQGATNETFEGIMNGTWYSFHIRQTFINPNDIFVIVYQNFNWSLVNSLLKPPFVSFIDFVKNVSVNPGWWLGYSAYGVPSNRTVVRYWFNEADSTAIIYLSCHITYVAEYIVGGQELLGWLVGFDLTPISIGTLKAWELRIDSYINGTSYYLYFKAPANILSERKDTYTLTLEVSPAYIGQKNENMTRVIEIIMPPNTEIQSIIPLNLSLYSGGNNCTFVIGEGDEYPMSFVVVSGPPTKSLGQAVWEALTRWVLEPSIWVAFATLFILVFTGLRGKQIWSRHKTYYRLYRAMVNVYDLYSTNFPKFHQEIDNLSKSVTQLFIEGKINDEQFDKLLRRRDDLMERATQIQPPPPP